LLAKDGVYARLHAAQFTGNGEPYAEENPLETLVERNGEVVTARTEAPLTVAVR
jgi:hypothetical protein